MLPPPELREWLLDELADLVETRGIDPVVNAPLVQPTPDFFPDPWKGNVASVRRLLRRLLRYTRLEVDRVEVVVYDPEDEVQPDEPSPPPMRGQAPIVWRLEPRPDQPWRFGLDVRALKDAHNLVPACARAVAHAYREHHRIPNSDAESAAPAVDVTAVYLGFGVLTVDASMRFSSGAQGGFRASRSQFRLGALSPQAVAYLLAAQALLRGLDAKQRRKLSSKLQPNQAEFFRQAVKQLETVDLFERLELPPEETWPDPPGMAWYRQDLDDPAVAEPEANDEDDDLERDHESIRGKNQGKPVFRVERNMIGTLIKATVVPTIFLGGMLTRPFMQLPVTMAHVSMAAIGMALISLVVGALLKDSRCSEPKCMARLSPDMETCPLCGGTIMGTIGNAKERLEAEERLVDEGRLPATSDGN